MAEIIRPRYEIGISQDLEMSVLRGMGQASLCISQ